METALGGAVVAMGRYACAGCGTSVRPRRKALDVEVSMTPTARRLASLAGSACCYAEADGLLAELAGCELRGEAGRAGAPRKAGGVDECARAAGYLAARRGQMRYGEYLARGLPIGSGRILVAGNVNASCRR